jgi:putative ABC transport system ATP-binding protein
MISLDQISRTFVSDAIETVALDRVNLSIAPGEFVAIMGPSGCGKSTLLNIIGTVDRPSSGAYWFDERDLAQLDEAALSGFRAANLGFVFQSFNLIDELSIQENIELGMIYARVPAAARRAGVQAAMDRVGISHRAKHFPHQLSGGQQQRAAIARAIVATPRLILADEPTGNLDSENGTQIMEILRSLNAEGATVVMVTHAPEHSEMASRRISMLDGRVVATAARS